LRRAPSIATWLFRHFGSRSRNDEIVGDLAEQYVRGRSRAWYWRQVLSAILIGASNDIWNNKSRALTALVVGWGLLHVGMTFGVWRIWNYGLYQFVVQHVASQPVLSWYTPTIIHLAATLLMLPLYAFAGWAVSRVSMAHSGIVLMFAATCAFLRFGSFWSTAYESFMTMDVRYVVVFLSYAFADLLIGGVVLLGAGRFTASWQRGPR
jgi:hypothetical protein